MPDLSAEELLTPEQQDKRFPCGECDQFEKWIRLRHCFYCNRQLCTSCGSGKHPLCDVCRRAELQDKYGDEEDDV